MSRIAMNMPKHITTKPSSLRRAARDSALPAPPVGERAATGSASLAVSVLMLRFAYRRRDWSFDADCVAAGAATAANHEPPSATEEFDADLVLTLTTTDMPGRSSLRLATSAGTLMRTGMR